MGFYVSICFAYNSLLCVLSSFAIILTSKRELMLLALIIFQISCFCIYYVALPHGAVGLPAVCDITFVLPEHIHLL